MYFVHFRRVVTFRRLAADVLALLVLVVLLAAGAGAEEVSSQPPAEFADHLEDLLTDPKDALGTALSPAERLRDGADGTLVLYEELTWVGDDGRIVTAEHRIYRANSDEAIEPVSRETVGFRRGEQMLHLVRAQTRTPGGRRVPVRSDAIFVQTPQQDADDGIYTDRAELVILYPQVEVGSAAELLVVREEEEFRIPGEFTDLTSFQYFWPADEIRRVIELPAAMARRLRLTPVGDAVPQVERSTLPDGRVRLEWRRRNVPAFSPANWTAPSHDRGPAVWASTLESWSDLTDWYRGLLAGRLELPAELRAQVDAWIAGVDDRMEIIQLLHSKVADDIRYTGLEFGIAGFQPKVPAEVWHDRFGDCKDKANLLRAFLHHAGISSHLVLLDTEHAGEIETRSPDFRQFDHAILAIEAKEGSRRLLFADPTISYLPAGALGPRAADRMVLLIEDSGYRFVRTPAQSAGTVEAVFDLELRPGGGVEGWAEIVARGYRSTAYRTYFEKEELWQRRAAFEGWLSSYFPGTEVVDVETDASAGRYRARLYLLQEDDAAAETHRLELPRMWSDWDAEELADPPPGKLFQHMQTTEVEVRYRLPEGSVTDLPDDVSFEAPGLEARAGWSCTPGLCVGKVTRRQNASLVASADLPALGRGVETLSQWVDSSPTLRLGESGAGGVETASSSSRRSPSESARSSASGAGGELENFPMMSSGAGQLRLVERRFPEDGNRELRRRALDRVAQWFPDEAEAVFEARIRRANLACIEENPSGAATMRATLEATDPAEVGAQMRGWARFMIAGCATVEDDESIEIYGRLLDDESLGAYRRGWSAWNLADLLDDAGRREEALAAVARGREVVDPASDVMDSLLAMELWLRSAEGDEQDPAALEALIETTLSGERGAERAVAMVNQLAAWESGGDADRVGRVLPLVASALASRSDFQAASDQLSRLRLRAADESTYRTLAGELDVLFDQSAPTWWDAVQVREFDDADALRRHIEELGSTEGEVAGYLRHQVLLLTEHPPADDFPQRLWTLLSVFDHFYADEKIVDSLVGLAGRLPASGNARYDALLLGADRVANGEGAAAALDHLAALRSTEELPQGYVAAADLRRARWLEELGRTEEALAAYADLVPHRGYYLVAYDADVERMLLLLETGEVERALEIGSALAEANGEDLATLDELYIGTSLVELMEDRERARAYWASHGEWFATWRELATDLGLQPPDHPTAPRTGNGVEFGERYGSHVQQRDLDGSLALLDEFLRAVRWAPSLLADVGTLLQHAMSLVPDAANELRALGVEILSTLPGEGPSVSRDVARQSRLMKSAFLVDLERWDESRREIEAYFAADPPRDNVSARMRLLQGMVAEQTEEDVEEALRELSAALTAEWADASRGLAVQTLMQLHRILDDPEAEAALIERELEHPAIRSSARAGGLRERLDELRKAPEETAEFAEALESWLAEVEVGWYEFARPHRRGDETWMEKSPEEWFTDEDALAQERIKAGLLVARDEARPLAERREALFEVADEMLEVSEFLPVVRVWVEGALERPVLGESLQRFMRMMELVLRFVEVGPDLESDLERLRATELWQDAREELAPLRDGMESLVRAVWADVESLEADLREMVSEPLPDVEKDALEAGLRRLLLVGEIAAAESIVEQLRRTGSEAEEEHAAFVFELRRTLREGPARHEMLDAICAAFPSTDGSLEMPDRWQDIAAIRANFVGLSQRHTRLHLPYTCQQRALEFVDIAELPAGWVWAMDGSDAGRARLVEIVIGAVEKAADDEASTRVVQSLFQILPLDDPSWTMLIPQLEEVTASAEYETTRQMLRVVRLARALRGGESIDWSEHDFDHEASRWYAESLRIRDLARRGETAELEEILASRDVDDLLDEALLDDHLRAARAVGDQDVLALLAKPLDEVVYRNVLKTWTDPTWIEMWWVLELARIADRPDLYPREWIGGVLELVENEVARARILLLDARLQKDWARAGEMAQQLLDLSRVDHDLHWDLARSADDRGDAASALLHVRLFLERVGSHDDLAEARAMRDRLEAAAGETG